MGAFHYRALLKTGGNTKGIVEADSARQARQLLRERGLTPLSLQLIEKNNSGENRQKIANRDLSLLTRQLATLLGAGIPIEEALQGVSEQTEKEKVRHLLMTLRRKLLEGYSLAQALKSFPRVFPEIYIAMVTAGEQSGRLDFVLERLADYIEHQNQVKQKLQQALIYPALMVSISLLIIGFLLTFVVPKIVEVFTSSGQSLPTMTKVLISLSDSLRQHGGLLFFLLFLCALILPKVLQYPSIKTPWHQFLLRLPMLKYFIRSSNLARYIHTFGILFAANVSVLDTMRIASSLVSNLGMQPAFEKASIKVKEGSSIYHALKETSYFTPLSLHLIGSGEKSGQIAPMMIRTGEQIDQDIKHLIDTSLTLLEPLIILFMGGMVLFIVLATLLPIFSMEQLVA